MKIGTKNRGLCGVFAGGRPKGLAGLELDIYRKLCSISLILCGMPSMSPHSSSVNQWQHLKNFLNVTLARLS